MSYKQMTAELLKTKLSYDRASGLFTWTTNNPNAKCGTTAGWINALGYRVICINKRHYLAHRLVWLYVTGEWPTAEIDHIDMDRANNRLANLRQSSSSQNKANKPKRMNTQSGLKGVSWDNDRKKWMAKIGWKGKTKNLGRFDCPAAAHFAYEIAAENIFGEFHRISQ